MNALLQTAINSHVLQKSTELEDRKSFSLDSLRDFFECKSKPLVLVGPPGTGKTKTILDMIQVARAKGSFVFVVSPTYQALFAVLDKMIDDEYFSEDQYLLFTSRAEGCYPAKYRNHLISHSDFKEMEHTKLEPLQIILTTHLNIKLLMDHVNMKFRFQDNEKKQSYTTIIDEASKMPVADYFYYVNTMQSMNPEPDKHYVLVGDDHQLDPFSQLNGIDSTSVLSLFINMPDENRDLYFLDRCYRFSNPALRIVSTIFYNGLQITPSDSMKKTHIRWAHKTRNGHEQVGSSAKNEEEATQILQWLQHNPNLKSIAVISPYNAQIIRIQELLKTEHPYVECLSIDSAQGRDFDTVLVSLVESNRPFTQNVNRLDVAVTRAKKETVIFGSIPNEGTGLHRLYTSILEEEGIERNKRFPALAATCDNTSGAAAAAEAGAAARCRVIPRAGRAAEAANNFPDLGTYTPKSVHKSKSRCLVVEKKRS